MFDPWASENSTLREKVAEHVFIADLSRTLMMELGMPCEVLRSEFDAFGYDLVIEANGIVRHLQLKTLMDGGKTADVGIQTALGNKPGGCVVWMVIDRKTLVPRSFLWFGGPPGSPLPPLGDREVRNSRTGKVRPGLRKLVKGDFTKVGTILELAVRMFGRNEAAYDRILIDHLASNGIALDSRPPAAPLDWPAASELAALVDAYALTEAAGLGDPGELSVARRAAAERSGRWTGSALELWISLCMERLWDRWQGEGAIGMDLTAPPLPKLDSLAATFGQKLAALGWPGRS